MLELVNYDNQDIEQELVCDTATPGLMSCDDKKKLDGIAEGANKYVHPGYTARTSGLYKITVDGNGHVSAVTAVTKADITALGIPGQDTNTVYTHPGTHPASMITQDATHRFVSDTEKNTWNGKVNKSGDTITGNLTVMTTNNPTITIKNSMGNDCVLVFDRATNNHWRLVNSSGKFYIQCNAAASGNGDYYTVLELQGLSSGDKIITHKPIHLGANAMIPGGTGITMHQGNYQHYIYQENSSLAVRCSNDAGVNFYWPLIMEFSSPNTTKFKNDLVVTGNLTTDKSFSVRQGANISSDHYMPLSIQSYHNSGESTIEFKTSTLACNWIIGPGGGIQGTAVEKTKMFGIYASSTGSVASFGDDGYFTIRSGIYTNRIYENPNFKQNGWTFSHGSDWSTNCPNSNGLTFLGMSDWRFKRLYAAESTINTSDIHDKDIISGITEPYEKMFMEFEPILYKWKNMEGDEAAKMRPHDRIHCGLGAQPTLEAAKRHGLDMVSFAAICRDDLETPTPDGRTERYGIAYGELHGLEIHMIQKNRNELNELKEENVQLKEEVNDMKSRLEKLEALLLK